MTSEPATDLPWPRRVLSDAVGRLRRPGQQTGSPDDLRIEVERIGDDWRQQPYYEQVEPMMDSVWRSLIWPFIEGSDLRRVLDLAAGHGRNTAKLLETAEDVWVTDINENNVELCRRRFAGEPRVRCFRGDGLTLKEISAESLTFVYCFDAMVHFDSDCVRSYLSEFRRVLEPGGRGFCHHSNLSSRPGGDLHDNPQWRNFMSRELFAHYCAKEGLRMLRQDVVDWGDDAEIDCLTLFERPNETEDR